jgi:hypothetical protein
MSVGGFEIAMHDAALMRVCNTSAASIRADGVFQRQRAIDDLAQRSALDVHGDERGPPTSPTS